MYREVNVINFNEGTLNINVEGNVKVSKAYSEKENITVVQLEKTKEYIPQFGDIIHLGEAYPFIGERLGIFNKCDRDYYGTIFSIFLDTNEVEYNNWSANERPIRLATEEECEVVFKKLKELGKKWNPTTKLIENIYVPQNGDFVFFKSKTSTQFEDVSIFNKKVGDNYYTYFSVYKEDNRFYNHIDDTCVHINESQILELRRANPEEIKFLLDKLKEEKLSWNPTTKTLSEIVEFEPKDGDFVFFDKNNIYYSNYIGIYRKKSEKEFFTYCFILESGKRFEISKQLNTDRKIRLCTEEEKAVLLKAIDNAGKYWDSKVKELKDKLVIGDLCIFWDNTTSLAMVSVLKKISEDEEYPYIACTDVIYTNCTKYISKEQYLDFIK